MRLLIHAHWNEYVLQQKKQLHTVTHLLCSALLIKIATRVSNSGGSTATVNPQPKRDFKRSSTP